MTRRPLLRKAGRIAAYAGAGVVALAAVIAVGAPIYFSGERFGRLVERVLPEMRGQIHIAGGHWSWATVVALVRSRPAALSFQRITMTDPEGTEVLHIENLSFDVEVHRHPTRVTVRDLEIKDARWLFANMKGNRKKVGFLAALEGVPHVSRKPSKPSSSEFSIEGARLDGIDVTFDQSDWGLVLRDVHARGALAIKSKTFTFDVSDADVHGGRLRILGEKNGILLPFERGRIDRVATTADQPDNIQLTASGVATRGSRTSGKGVFTGIYGLTPASKHNGIDLVARIENAADAVNAIAAHRGLGGRVQVGGAGADLRMHFKEPFDWVTIDAEARGFDVKSGDIDVRKLGFHVAAQPRQRRAHVDHLSLASAEGGRLEAEATLDRLQLDATVNTTHFGARTLLPSALRQFAGGTLDGMLHARADFGAGDAELVRSTLVITRGEDEKGPRTVALLAGKSVRPPPGAMVVRLTGAKLVDGVLRVPRVSLSMWGGGLAAEGRVALWDPAARSWLSPPRLDVALHGSNIRIERLIGSNFAGGVISFIAHAHGPANDLALDIGFPQSAGVTVLGERVRLPARATLRLDEAGLVLDSLPLGGPGTSALIVAGRIAHSGRLALDVGIREFPLAHLPGILGTTLPVEGAISGAVRLVGESRMPALTGQLTLAGVSFAGHALGGGTIAITPEKKGAVRARGWLIDAVAVDGHLALKPSGLEGEVTLTLAKLPIEPFLPRLPARLVARGVVSGTAMARIAPDHPATAEGRLSELAVSLSSPAGPGRPAGTLDVRAENEIVIQARAGEGLTLGAARLRSSLGLLELAGESHGDDLRATLRGRLELGGLAAFARPWVDRIAGAVDVDLAATGRGALDDVSVSGSVAIAAPVSLKPAKLSIEASVPSGRLRVVKNVVETTALPIVVRAEGFPTAAVRKLDAGARVSARLDGANGKLGARVALDRLDINIPLIGRKPIRAGGEIDIAGDLTKGKIDVTRIDLPFTAEAEAMTVIPGATVDRATVALRVRGSSKQLALSGDVDVGSAHARASALKSSSGGGGGAGGAGAKKGPLADHPEIEAMRLDVRVRSQHGAINVDVNHLPDLRLDVDLHVTGTVKKPSISGAPHGANAWTSFVLAVAKLFS